jgi:hypothetical protein
MLETADDKAHEQWSMLALSQFKPGKLALGRLAVESEVHLAFFAFFAFDRLTADFFAAFAIKKSSLFLPAFSSAANHPAVPPRPDHVSPVSG